MPKGTTTEVTGETLFDAPTQDRLSAQSGAVPSPNSIKQAKQSSHPRRRSKSYQRSRRDQWRITDC